jgi:hypothetical protein
MMMGLILPYFKPFTLRGFFQIHKLLGSLGKLRKFFSHVAQNIWAFWRIPENIFAE